MELPEQDILDEVKDDILLDIDKRLKHTMFPSYRLYLLKVRALIVDLKRKDFF